MKLLRWLKERANRRHEAREAAELDAKRLLAGHTPREAWLEARQLSQSEPDREKHWQRVKDEIVRRHGSQDKADTATRYLENNSL